MVAGAASIRKRGRRRGRAGPARGSAVRRHVDQPPGRPAVAWIYAGLGPARSRPDPGHAAGGPRAPLLVSILRPAPARCESGVDRRLLAVRRYHVLLLHVLLRAAHLAGGASGR